jgi:hypothetical protein
MGLCPVDGIAQTLPSPEEFVNAIFQTVVDSSFSKYYLSEQAAPCSFVKFDYDEWVKYALRETVTMEVLNELAERSYNDRKPMSWRKERLGKAVCINEKKIDSILDPALDLRKDGTPAVSGAGAMTDKERQRADIRQKKFIHKQFIKWSQLPPEQRTVFFFSRPLFTGDGQYAIIDLDYRCDAQQCGAGSICLFHRQGTGWKLIGQKTR